MDTTVPTKEPENAIVANLLLSSGGAHFDHTAWMQGNVTPCRKKTPFQVVY